MNRYQLNLDPRLKPRIQKFSSKLRQMYVALGPFLIAISSGLTEGFSAILLPQLQEENIMKIDDNIASWIASIAALPMSLGCILGGILMEKIGRKTVYIVTCFPCFIGWLIIYFAYNINMLLIGRFLTGISAGILGPVTGVYIGETSEPKFRGFLLPSITLADALGIFLSHLLGTYLTWKNTSLICCSFPLACFFVMTFAPESPTYLAKMGKMEQARKAFFWCRGYSKVALEEMDVLMKKQTVLSMEPQKSCTDNCKILKKPEFYKPLIIILIFFTTLQFSGNNAMTFYSVTIIKQTIGEGLDEYLIMLIIDSLRLLAAIMACYILKIMGRRPLAILCGVGTFTSLLTLSCYTYLTKTYPDLSKYSFISLTALVCYVSFMTLGLVPLPWTMIGEVFPLANRGLGSGISAMYNCLMFFVVVKITPLMFLNLGAGATFLVYGMCCFVGTLYLGLFLPETRNKPLHVIEDHFKNTK